MSRLSGVFVAICMVLIAVSFGAVLYLSFALSGAEASVVALAALTGLALYNGIVGRGRFQREISAQIGDLAGGTTDLARQVTEQGRRLAAIEKSTDSIIGKALAVTQPIQIEIDELGGLVKQLAESVAAHDVSIRNVARGAAVPPPRPVAPAPATPAPFMPVPITASSAPPVVPEPEHTDVVASRAPAPTATSPADGPFKGMSRDAVVAVVRDAVEADRFDIYLQPIVTLPQRKVRFYEALARLRTADGKVVTPTDFLAFAEAGGLVTQIDRLMLARVVRVARRLHSKTKDVAVFCNLAAASLNDRDAFAHIAEVMEANRVLAGVVIFELPLAAFRTMGTRDNEAMATLAKFGFKFSVDHITDLRFSAQDLAERGCAFIKMPATVLLDRSNQAGSDIHAQDLAGLLARSGIELIAERIEHEETAINLLDYEVKFGQGFLFSPPRPVRPEVLQGAPSDAASEPPRIEGAPEPRIETPSAPAVLAGPLPITTAAQPGNGSGASALARLARVVVRPSA